MLNTCVKAVCRILRDGEHIQRTSNLAWSGAWGSFQTTGQTVGIQVEHIDPVVLRRQSLDLGAAGPVKACRELTRKEGAARA